MFRVDIDRTTLNVKCCCCFFFLCLFYSCCFSFFVDSAAASEPELNVTTICAIGPGRDRTGLYLGADFDQLPSGGAVFC